MTEAALAELLQGLPDLRDYRQLRTAVHQLDEDEVAPREDEVACVKWLPRAGYVLLK